MANWISSKLKVAETLLQQIDQQAADSLRKNDKPRSEELSLENPTKSAEVVPLKDQLKKKKKKKSNEENDLIGKSNSDYNLNLTNGSSNNNNNRESKVARASLVNIKPSVSPPNSGVTDSDWTELLSVPSPAVNRSNGVSEIRGLRKEGRRPGNWGLNLPALETKRRNQKSQNSGLKNLQKSDMIDNKANSGSTGGGQNGGGDSRVMDTMQKTSSVELEFDDDYSEGRELDRKDVSPSPVLENKNEVNEKRIVLSQKSGDKEILHFKESSVDADLQSSNKDHPKKLGSVTVDGISDLRIDMGDDRGRFSGSIGGTNGPNVGQRSSPSIQRESHSISDGVSDSETDSMSSSDSESEHEREERKRRRAQILAEKAAAKAIEAIKDRENRVARLEGEKQSLQKILEERAKQQAQEASELQNTMMEMMDAVELEKQKHNHTRMESLARLTTLESANADLARSFATAQWNLEVEVNRVAELRQQIELKEASQEELRRKICATRGNGNQLVASKGVEFERGILQAEYSFVNEKIGQLQEKAKALETDIDVIQKEILNPTDVEVELKQRLAQLTDHLIKKQAQVESLSSEKATLLFRIEAVSRMLDENKSMLNAGDIPSTSSREDIESGIWKFSNSKLRPLFEERVQFGRKHLGSVVRQLDYIFCMGAVFLRKNSTARLWSFVYLGCLHLWVIYILMSHSPVSDEARSGAVFSLENINKTGGV